MSKIKDFYKRNIYGIIGTLLFHLLLMSSFLLAEVKLKGKVKEEPIIIDFADVEKPKPKKEPAQEKQQKNKNEPSTDRDKANRTTRSNQAVNDAAKKDPFFDKAYQQEIADAKKLVTDVNKQLKKKVKDIKEFEMPEETTEGMNPDSIKNTIYSGASNIHYYLKNRFHRRLPIPVYLAEGGGLVVVNIWVDQQGKVVKAEIKSTSNSSDPMLEVYAKQAALRTIFNADASAPSPQKGTISYNFVPQ